MAKEQDPAEVKAELLNANARVRELQHEVNGVQKERKTFQRQQEVTAEAQRNEESAVSQFQAVQQENERLKNELDSERKLRASEQQQVAAAKAIKDSFGSL